MPSKTDGDPTLPILSEKILSYAIRPSLLAYCPRTELFAVVNDGEAVDAYRYGGQRAFTVKRKSPQLSVVGLQWIRHGKCLAVALSNGTVDIVSGETGKIVRQGGHDPFSAADASDTKPDITCLGWGTLLTADIGNEKISPGGGPKSSSSVSSLFDGAGPTTEDWYEADRDLLDDEATPGTKARAANLNDLPRRLALINVESILPRLSPIAPRPNAGDRHDMFATQAALDDYFTSMQERDGLVAEVLFVGRSDGQARVVVDDILEIGYSPRHETDRPKIPLAYSSHPQCTTHALLRASTLDDQDGEEQRGNVYSSLSLSVFDIPLMSSGGSHLHLIVSRTAQLRDLCSYISYAIACTKSDWTTHTNLPSRFMENINETLTEKNEGTLSQNLFHLAMTGNFTPTMLEWLKDELAERGHKRWDHAMTSFYTETSKTLQTNLLPCIERCTIVTTNLRGLAKFYEGSKKFDVPPATFTAILSALANLQLLVHEAIAIVHKEWRCFGAFSKWLRHQVDMSAADPESVSGRDMADREVPNLDVGRTLMYIEGPLTASRLQPFIFPQPPEDPGVLSKEELVSAIKEAREGTTESQHLLSLHGLSAHLNQVCREAHRQILGWQQSAGPTAEELELEPGPTSHVWDMKTMQLHKGSFRTIVLAVPLQERNKISIHSITQDNSTSKKGSPSAKPHKDWRIVDFPPSHTILSLKFLDDTSALVLLQRTGDTRYMLVRLPLSMQNLASQVVDLRDENMLEEFVVHVFGRKEGFVPAEVVANGTSGKQSVLVVAEDRRQWRTFDLEASKRGMDGEHEGQGEGEGESEDGVVDSMVID